MDFLLLVTTTTLADFPFATIWRNAFRQHNADSNQSRDDEKEEKHDKQNEHQHIVSSLHNRNPPLGHTTRGTGGYQLLRNRSTPPKISDP
jgi:hypothetical protein